MCIYQIKSISHTLVDYSRMHSSKCTTNTVCVNHCILVKIHKSSHTMQLQWSAWQNIPASCKSSRLSWIIYYKSHSKFIYMFLMKYNYIFMCNVHMHIEMLNWIHIPSFDLEKGCWRWLPLADKTSFLSHQPMFVNMDLNECVCICSSIGSRSNILFSKDHGPNFC